MTEENAKHMLMKCQLPIEGQDNSHCPDANPCLARNLSMLSLTSGYSTHCLLEMHYCRTESSLSEAEKISNMLEEFLAEPWLNALAFLHLLYSALHVQSTPKSVFQ